MPAAVRALIWSVLRFRGGAQDLYGVFAQQRGAMGVAPGRAGEDVGRARIGCGQVVLGVFDLNEEAALAPVAILRGFVGRADDRPGRARLLRAVVDVFRVVGGDVLRDLFEHPHRRRLAQPQLALAAVEQLRIAQLRAVPVALDQLDQP